ncbi:MAG: hypothetical protein WCP62_04410 [Planctomycetota bacterium]|jgi:hypothetical protein
MNSIFKTYLVTGVIVCLLFGTAALSGWRLPKYDTGSSSSRTSSSSRSGGSSFFGGSGSTSGRSSGGSWGGGK